MSETPRTCEGCLSGYDIGLPSSGIAYPHPDCPEHGDSWLPHDNQWSRDYVTAHPERFTAKDESDAPTTAGKG